MHYINKINYLIKCFLNYFQKKRCPSCGSNEYNLIDKKFIVSRLYKCKSCYLLYRHPTDDHHTNFKFYQKKYTQNDNITTDLPTKIVLAQLINNNFEGKNINRFVELFKNLLNTSTLSSFNMIDYGCSWGYQSYQFLRNGINCYSYEISKPRAKYGNDNLGLNIYTDDSQLPLNNDIFFSSHVIEHVPSPNLMIAKGLALLKSGGYFIAYSPNGSDEFRINKPNEFHLLWGQVHPNFLTAEYYQNIFKNNPYLISSSPFTNINEEILNWDKKSQKVLNTNSSELLVIAINSKI